MNDAIPLVPTKDSNPTLSANTVGDSNRMLKHIPALDGMRGVAIILVMLHHFFLYGGMVVSNRIDKWFHTIILTGWIGVDLFFVLSGFLISSILLGSKNHDGFFRTFFARRILRIFPLYYTVLMIVFLLAPRIFPVDAAFQSLNNQQLWYWTYLTNFPIAFDGWPAYLPLGHFWSLAVEEQFYLFWPLVVFLLSRIALIRVSIFFIIASFVIRLLANLSGYPLAAYVLTLARMDALAVGALIALVAHGDHGLAVLLKWVRPVIVTIGILLLGLFLWRRDLNPEDVVTSTVGFSLLAIFFGAVVVQAVTAPDQSLVNRLFSSRLLRFFGVYSYALYIFHHPVAILLNKHFLSVRDFPQFGGSQLPGQLIFIGVAGSISVGLALLSWNLLEVHFLKLKKHFQYHPQQTSNSSS